MSRENFPAVQRHQRQRIAFGLVVMVVGLFALLDNLHILDSRLVRPLWPLVFVVAGVLRLQSARHSGAGRAVGAVFIVLGVAWTLAGYGFMHFSLHQWWPMLLIAGGVWVVVRAVQRAAGGDADLSGGTGAEAGTGMGTGRGASADSVHAFGLSDGRQEHASRLDLTAVFGGSVVRNDTQAFEGGELTVAMAGLEIDLRQAAMAAPEAVLNVFVLMGGIVLRVPPGWSVVVRGSPVMGGIEDKTVPTMGSAHRLVIDGYVIMGGIEVKN